MVAYAIWNNKELRRVEAKELLDQAYFLFTKRLAVRFGRILFVRRTVADVALDDDQRRSVARAQEALKGELKTVNVVRVTNMQHIPAIREETRGNILGKGDVSVALDTDAVTVINPTQIRQLQMSRRRCGLTGNTLH